jgi:hypothetical protein
LAAYFGLLLFAVSGLVLQGGIWMIAGTVGWFSVVIACLLLRYRGGSAKKLEDLPVRRVLAILGASEKDFSIAKVFAPYPLPSGRDFVVLNLAAKCFVGFMVFVGGFVG